VSRAVVPVRHHPLRTLDNMSAWWYALIAIGALLVLLAGVAFAFVERVPDWDPKGKRILITGGSSGIGLATAELLAKQGAAAIAILARDQRKIDDAVPLIRRAGAASGTQVFGVSADVSVQGPVQAGCEESVALMGGIDAVVCCAGASYPCLFLATAEADFDRLMQVNYSGTVYVLKAVVPHLVRNGPRRGGRIMLVSSMAGLSGVAGYTAYSASKFALRGLAEALHMELSGPHGIAVSVANPPDVNTPMLAKENEIKPKECLQISEGSGLFEASAIANDMVSALRRWRFLVNSGLDGHMLSLIASGTSPAHSGLWGTLELMSLGVLRVVSLAYRWNYNAIVQKVHAERVSGKLEDAGALAFKKVHELGEAKRKE